MRPERLVVIVGTTTDVGKTWVAAALIGALRCQGQRVAARKPVQSFGPGPVNDADVLAGATGEDPLTVCPSHRRYERAMAPPMAAEALGRPSFTVADLIGELRWPAGIDTGVVEGVGGVRSPLADDADNVDLVARLHPEHVVLVADAGLGVVNLVRMSAEALTGAPLVVYLNRFDGADDLHRRNRRWIDERLSLTTMVSPEDLVRHLAP